MLGMNVFIKKISLVLIQYASLASVFFVNVECMVKYGSLAHEYFLKDNLFWYLMPYFIVRFHMLYSPSRLSSGLVLGYCRIYRSCQVTQL